MSVARTFLRARLANLLVPGLGWILLDQTALGVAIAVAFAMLANAAVTAEGLFPDEFSAPLRALLLGAAALTYGWSQWAMQKAVRRAARERAARLRRTALREYEAALRAGDGHAALESLRRLVREASADLSIAVRMAEAWSLIGDADASRRAWEHVRRIDRHHVYRETVALHLDAGACAQGEGGGD